MELKKWRVYLDGVLLNNLPNGLDKFSKEFVRDKTLHGIYSVSSFDLIFIGDGYCNLKDFQNEIDSCQKLIRIDKYCNDGWAVVFDGIIEVGSVELDESLSQATCEIQDNSPLILISRNSDLLIDVETTKGIYGNTIIPATFNSFQTRGFLGAYYDSFNVTWDDAFRVVLESITGKKVNISSTYLTLTPQKILYSVLFSGTLANITNITFTYKNFQGETLVVTTSQTGYNAIVELRNLLYNEGYDLFSIVEIENSLRYEVDYRNILSGDFDTFPNPTIIYLYNNLPIEIISIDVIGSSAISTTITKVNNYIDGGNNPVLLNYKALKGGVSPYLLQYSFKELIDEFYKLYNVYFIATYNSSGEIDFIINSENDIYDSIINYTFDNIKNLKVSFNEDSIYKNIITSDGSSETLSDCNRTLNSEFCGLGNELDISNEFILGGVPIQTELPLIYDNSLVNNKYIIDNNGLHEIVTYIYYHPTILSANVFMYNIWCNNWNKIYRHLNKFKNSLIGIGSYYKPSSNDYSITIYNNVVNKFIKKYEFNTSMSESDFNKLSDNVVDMAQFKTNNSTTYRIGIISNVRYNYNTGEAEITILGE